MRLDITNNAFVGGSNRFRNDMPVFFTVRVLGICTSKETCPKTLPELGGCSAMDREHNHRHESSVCRKEQSV